MTIGGLIEARFSGTPVLHITGQTADTSARSSKLPPRLTRSCIAAAFASSLCVPMVPSSGSS
jgi:hypothetical protein